MIGNLMRTLLGAAIDGFKRFPFTVVGILATAILANMEIANLLNLSNSREVQLFSAVAAFSLASLVKQIGVESYGFNIRLQHVAAFAAGVIAAALAWFAKDIGLTHLAFFAGLTGAIFVAAHWFRGTSEGFWFFVIRLMFAVALAFTAVIVFGLGVSAILASLDYLFGVGVPGRLYAHIWSTSLIAAGPIFALGRIPKDFDAKPFIDGNNHGIAGLRLLSDYLAAPLLAVYALILHAYALKILITSEVPQGQIGWMVIGFGTLIIFFWKVMLPLRDVLTVSGRLFLKIWPVLVIIPLILLGYALYLRISEYGVTPERYFLVAFGGLMLLFALMQAVPFTRNWLPGAAPLTVIVLILGSFGPWGAEQVSLSSQVNQFAQLLDDKSHVRNGEGNRAANLLRYLRKHDGLDLLKPFTTEFEKNPFEIAKSKSDWKLQNQLEYAFKIDIARSKDDQIKGQRNVNFKRGIVSVEGFDLHLSNVSLFPDHSLYKSNALSHGYIIETKSTELIVSFGNRKSVFSLEPLRAFLSRATNKEDARSFELVSGERKLLIVPVYLNMQLAEKVKLVSGSASIFLRKKDWEQGE
jgi:hypothetical protein